MGPAGLTAVFGMGTGVAPPVWSPGMRPAGGEARRSRIGFGVRHDSAVVTFQLDERVGTLRTTFTASERSRIESGEPSRHSPATPATTVLIEPSDRPTAAGGGGPIGVVKPLGC